MLVSLGGLVGTMNVQVVFSEFRHLLLHCLTMAAIITVYLSVFRVLACWCLNDAHHMVHALLFAKRNINIQDNFIHQKETDVWTKAGGNRTCATGHGNIQHATTNGLDRTGILPNKK